LQLQLETETFLVPSGSHNRHFIDQDVGNAPCPSGVCGVELNDVVARELIRRSDLEGGWAGAVVGGRVEEAEACAIEEDLDFGCRVHVKARETEKEIVRRAREGGADNTIRVRGPVEEVPVYIFWTWTRASLRTTMAAIRLGSDQSFSVPIGG